MTSSTQWKIVGAVLAVVIGLSIILPSQAAPITDLCSIPTSLGALPCTPDTEDAWFTVSDTDGLDDDITSFILERNASYENAVGIFDPFDTTNSLELWGGTVAPGFPSGVVLNWDGSSYTIEGTASTWTASNATYASYFGMYIDTPDTRYYSYAPYNPGGLDHLATFLTEGLGGATTGFDIVFAWEDLPNLGDKDYNDILYGCIDCLALSPFNITQVPEPAPLFLMGAGLAALAVRRRKKSGATGGKTV